MARNSARIQTPNTNDKLMADLNEEVLTPIKYNLNYDFMRRYRNHLLSIYKAFTKHLHWALQSIL